MLRLDASPICLSPRAAIPFPLTLHTSLLAVPETYGHTPPYSPLCLPLSSAVCDLRSHLL